MVAAYMKKGHAQYDLCNLGLYSKTINMVWVSPVLGLVEKVNVGIFLDAIGVINVKVCKMVLLIELYLFILPSLTLTLFQGCSSIKQSEVI